MRSAIGKALDHLRQTIREFLGISPTLDLHGLGVREALEETERFLRQAQATDQRVVRIVYGKGHGSPGGRGVLRDVVPRWIEREGAALVERYERLPDTTGADGAVKVWVRATQATATLAGIHDRGKVGTEQ